MKSAQITIKTKGSAAVIAMIVGHVGYAGGFSLYTEGSPAAIGNFAAGIAAEGADASIGWYNPAGLVLIKKQQAVVGGVGVLPSVKLTGSSTYTTTGASPYSQQFNGLQGAENAGVPSFHYARPFGDQVVFGLSVIAPFGLSTNYGLTSPVRYAATLSQLETINVSPAFGLKMNDYLSFGAGLDLQYARVKFNRIIGSPAVMQLEDLPATILDSESYNAGDSFGVGFHTGLMLRLDEDHTRFGLNYQSQMGHQFNGYSQLTGPLADPALTNILDPEEVLAANPKAQLRGNHLSSNNIQLPSIVTLSGYQDINKNWALLGSIVYSGWHSFKTIKLNNVAAIAANPDGEDGSIIQTTSASATTPEDYRDTWRFAAGANYHINDRWMVRVGGGYDQTPTVGAHRDARLPDADRWALAIGAHYQIRANLGIDMGYTYLFANPDAIINNTTQISSISSYNVNASANNYAQLLGLQVVWKIDQKA